MKKNKINIKTIIIIVLICTNISFLLIMLNMKNKNVEGQEIVKEQLEEATTDNSYIALSTHISELENKQQEINNMQNTAGQATVTSDKILKNYTAYKDGKLITGTMSNNGAVTKSLAVGGSYTIPAGYHNGSGKVTNAVTNKGTLTLGSTNGTAVDITDGYYTHVNTTAVYNAAKKFTVKSSSIKTFYDDITDPDSSLNLGISSKTIDVTKGKYVIIGVNLRYKNYDTDEVTVSCTSGMNVISSMTNRGYNKWNGTFGQAYVFFGYTTSTKVTLTSNKSYRWAGFINYIDIV